MSDVSVLFPYASKPLSQGGFSSVESALFDIKVTLLVAAILTATITTYLYFQGIGISGWAPFCTISGGLIIPCILTQTVQIIHKKRLHDEWKKLLQVDSFSAVDMDKVEDLLARGASVDRVDTEGLSLLHYASYFGEEEQMERLLVLGAQVDVANRYGITPLLLALANEKWKAAETLFAHGASLEIRDKKGTSLLHLAILDDNIPVLKWLISKKPHLNPKNKEGDTPLVLAVRENKKWALEELLIAGAMDHKAID